MDLATILSIIAILVSLISVGFSWGLLVVSNRIEINKQRFQQFALDVIEEKFSAFEQAMEEYDEDLVANFLTRITDFYVDLVMYCITLKEIYPKIDVDNIQNLCNDYSDYLYEHQMTLFKDHKIMFISNKLKTLNKLYDYAIYSELSYFSRLIVK